MYTLSYIIPLYSKFYYVEFQQHLLFSSKVENNTNLDHKTVPEASLNVHKLYDYSYILENNTSS